MMSSAPIMPSSSMTLWYLRRYADANMTSLVEILRIDDPVIDADNPSVAEPVKVKRVYQGKARIYQASGQGGTAIADEDMAFSTSYISIPSVDPNGAVIPVQVNDFFRIIDTGDPELVGRMFRVLDVDAGGQWSASRRCMVTGAQRYEGWTWIYE
jgi:hypothetical protein